MAIITIARALGSLGEEVAQELGRLTGYPILDKQFIEDRLEAFGFAPGQQEKLDERRPGFWATLSEKRSDYLHYLRTVLYDEAQAGGRIVMGRGGSAIFRTVPSHLAVRITAPLEFRMEKAVDLCACDERHAKPVVEQSDHERSGFNKLYFGLDWNDPCAFDITLNTSRMSAAQAAEIIDTHRKLVIDAGREEAGKRKLADLVLAQRVLTVIVYEKKIHVQGISATAEGGRVELFGISNTQHAIDRALEAAASLPSVTEVVNSMQLAQELQLLP
ncbi:MAG TPA: cytidylate kinase family protein [Rectinemataceae bacterium]|nr:cytidylate kinase family protein [Rectinemataceae bacterium]